MAGFLKAFLIAIIAVAALVLFMNMAFFFPWYLEIIQTTFEVSQWVATYNYLDSDNYERIHTDLSEKPIFRERKTAVAITAYHDGDKTRDAIDQVLPYNMSLSYYDEDPTKKPYVQMGNMVEITVSAAYPFRMQIFGEPLVLADINVSFPMTTTTTRHYKDLPYNYGPDGEEWDE